MRIGICGYAESGKDEVADVFVEKLGFVKIGMSDALDQYLLILDPWVEMQFGDPTRYSEVRKYDSYVEAKRNPEVRRLLQLLGTEVGRKIDEDLLVKELDKTASAFSNVVVTGIRYLNEAEAVDKLIWVQRPGIGPANDHSSEQQEPVFARADYKFVNDGTLEDLKRNAERLAYKVFGRKPYNV